MKTLKNLILLAVIVYVIWKYILKKPVPQITMPSTDQKSANDPVQFAEQKLKDLQQAIKENFPEHEEQASEILDGVQNAINEFEKVQEEIEKKYTEGLPMLSTDDAMTTSPVTKDPYREFVPISEPMVKPLRTSLLSTRLTRMPSPTLTMELR